MMDFADSLPTMTHESGQILPEFFVPIVYHLSVATVAISPRAKSDNNHLL